MGLSAAGATFTFFSDKGNMSANIVGLSVETPEAQMVDMTPTSLPANVMLMVPTGEYKGGSISVDYIRFAGQVDATTLLGGVGIASFSSPRHSVARRVMLRRASEEARVGDVVRGTMEFAWTDYGS